MHSLLLRSQLAFLLLACATISPLHAEPVYLNDMEKPSTVNGVASGWKFTQHEGALKPSLATDAASGSGSQAVALLGRSTGWLLSDFIEIKPGTEYQLQFQAKRTGKLTYFVRPLFFVEQKWNRPTEGDKAAVISADWKAYRLTFTAPKDCHFLILQAWIVGESGQIWLDAVSVEEASHPTAKIDKIIQPPVAFPATPPTPLPARQITTATPPKQGYGVALHNGVPTVFHNGVPLVIQSFHNCTWNPVAAAGPLAQEMAKAGVHIHMLQTALDWGKAFASGGVGVYGTANNTLDQRIEAILKMDPDARFLLNVHCFVPNSWYETDLGEMLQGEDGTPVKFRPEALRGFNSWASLKWRDEVNHRIGSLITHLKSRPYYDRIVGLHTFAGWEGQWTWPRPHPSAYTDQKVVQRLTQLFADYSPAMTNAFRTWCRKQYQNDLARLRTAWEMPEVTFDTIRVPPLSLLDVGDVQELRDLALGRTRYVRDYYLAFIDARVSAMESFAHTIKSATQDRPLLSGSYYGAILFAHVGGTLNALRELHGYSRRFVESPDLDYFISPPHHYIHEPGGATVLHLLTDSMIAHGKLALLENDIPTHLNQKRTHQFNTPGAIAHDRAGSVSIIERSFAYVLTKGMGVWWWDEEMNQKDGTPVWYADPALLQTLAQTSHIGQEALAWDRTPVSEIAVFYDELSNLYLKPVARGIGRDLLMEQLLPFLQIGAPVEFYAIEDIDFIRPHKLYIFWNAFHVSAERRHTIQNVLRRNHATALWIYAPGVASDTSLSADNITALTGMMVVMADERGVFDTRLSNVTHPITQSLAGQIVGSMKAPEFSDRRKESGTAATFETINGKVDSASLQKRDQTDVVGPHFYIEAPQATVLGRSVENDRPTLAIKEFTDWKSVYAAFYPVNAPLMREIARYAGVHLYSNQNDTIDADASLLAIHTAKPGPHRLELPRPARVIDLFSGKELSASTSTIDVPVEGPTTRLFRLLPPEK